MTERQEGILKGTIAMYDNIGEMVPVKMFSRIDLDVLVESNKIKIVDNPYNISDDFFGLVGKKYPIGLSELTNYRKIRDFGSTNENARKSCNCITL